MDVTGPRVRQEIVLFSSAYDAGSERNDELCASFPGPASPGDNLVLTLPWPWTLTYDGVVIWCKKFGVEIFHGTFMDGSNKGM